MTSILLETGRLRLRRFTIEDVDLLVALDSDPEVMRFITYGVPTPRATYADVILPRWFALYESSPLLGYWAAEDREGGGFLGWFHLRPDRMDPDEQELGYRLARAAWGRDSRPKAPRRSSVTGSSAWVPQRSRRARWQATSPPSG